MGSDIYTESAVAIRLYDFLDRKEVNKKSVRSNIIEELAKKKLVAHSSNAIKNIDSFIDYFTSKISMNDGYEKNKENNHLMLRIFCDHVGISFNSLVDFELRSFDNNREAGYDIEVDTIYLMFQPQGLFETKMTKAGKELAKTLELKEIKETTWTVHSY